MTANIKTLVDAFVTQINDQDFNIAEDINALQEALDAIAYANVGQASFANTETLSGTKTLTDDSPALQFLNPNAADRDVPLPAVAATNHAFVIMNTNGSNYVLTVKNAGGTVIRIIPAGKTYMFISDGTQWVVVGFDLYKTISPAQITASQNNYNPTGAYEADIMRLDSDAAWDMTGLAGGSAGRMKIIRNIGAYTLTFKNEDASSTAANRFDFGADFELETKKTMLLIYDPTSARWGMIGGGGAGSAGAGMTKSIASVTTSNVTGVVGTQHILDVSGMTANRNFVLPAGTAGDEIEVDIAVGDDTYALILIGDTGITITGNGVTTGAATEWSRLFISGEKVRFIATSATNWLVSDDGRVKQIGIMERQTSQSINSGSDTKIQFATSITNIGNVVDNATNYRITVRRAGNYSIVGFVSLAGGLDDQETINALVYKNGAFDRYLANYVSAAAADRQSYANISYKKSLAAGDYIELYINHNEGAAVNTNTSNYPQLSVIEEF